MIDIYDDLPPLGAIFTDVCPDDDPLWASYFLMLSVLGDGAILVWDLRKCKKTKMNMLSVQALLRNKLWKVISR